MKNYVVSCIAVIGLATLAFLFTPQSRVDAHCQVPCGIYDDPARIHAMLEDVTTITKAMNQINELSKSTNAQSLNQAVRWIDTKEHHAGHIITTVAEYFLTQKVKDVAPGSAGYQDYLDKLATHHRVMRAAMVTKQTVDTKAAGALKTAVEELGKLYPDK